jgi:hypothetical protein
VANLLVEFNDSQVGVVLATSMHALGAIAFLGGLVGYLAWHRQLVQHGHHHRRLLEAASVLTYLAIVVNLLGGFMRTYQTGHPSVTEFASSAWVRAIVIKHVFIFAGMIAAVYLLERVALRHLRAFKDGTLADLKQDGHRIGVVVVVLGILVSAVLGAMTQVIPLAAADADGQGDGTDDGMDHDVATAVRYVNATGQLTSTPVQPAASTGGFEVDHGTAVLEATFLWAPPAESLVAELVGPTGQTLLLAGDGRAAGEVVAPAPGSWSYNVRANVALGAQWELSVRLTPVSTDGGETLMADTTTIAPGQFFEINTEAEEGATLHWAWSTEADIHFDIHTHFDDEVQYVVEEQSGGSSGAYTVVRTGGHSYLWENTGVLPVTLTYRVWGVWELDSTFPPSA